MTTLKHGTPQEAGLDPDRIKMLHKRAEEWCDGHRMRSGVLLAARKGVVAFYEAYGPLTNETDSPPAQKDSIFSVASVSKSVTATAIMMLVEDGRLGLNRPIQEYIPSLRGKGMEDVEVQHLLTHTSGLEGEKTETQFSGRIQDIAARQDPVEEGQHPFIANRLACHTDLEPSWTPGTRMEYCGFNYDLLGEIVRATSGQTLDQFADERIFQPLGMKDSTYIQDKTKLDRWVKRGEGVIGGSVSGDPMSGMEGQWVQNAPWGGNGLTTTAWDLAIFAQMFLSDGQYGGERYISPAGHHEMTRNQIPGIKSHFLGQSNEGSWGLGWMVQGTERWRWTNSTLQPVGTYSHGGFGGHFFWIDPVNDIIAVHLSVCLDMDLERHEHKNHGDLFQNMVTAAVID